MIRAALGTSALLQGGLSWTGQTEPVAGLLFVSAGVLLVTGFLTPMAAIISVMCIVGGRFSFPVSGTVNLFAANLPALFAIVMAAGLLLLGPGAYSADGRLFGPREIIISPAHRPPK